MYFNSLPKPTQQQAGDQKESTELQKKPTFDLQSECLIGKVFSFLDPKSRQSTALVNRHWRKHSLISEASNFNRLVFILKRQFNQAPYPEVKKALFEFSRSSERLLPSKDEEFLPPIRFSQLKSDLTIEKDSLAKALKAISKKDRSTLIAKVGEEKSTLSEEVFAFADIYKKLDIVHSIQSDDKRDIVLQKYYMAFVKSGNLEKTLELVDNMTDDSCKTRIIRSMSEAFMQSNDYKEAIAFTSLMPDIQYVNADLVNIFRALINSGKIEEALVLLNNVKKVDDKDFILHFISEDLAENGKIEKALDLANSITSDYTRSKALCKISKALAKNGRIEEALDLAKTIPVEFIRFQALCKISEALAKNGRIEEALDLAETLTYESDRADALCEISGALAKNGRIEEALDLAKTIPVEFIRFQALCKISEALAKNGKIQEAQELFKTIPKVGTSTDIEARRAITEALANSGKIEEALEFARDNTGYRRSNFLPNDLSDLLLNDLSRDLTKSGNIEKAVEVANRINKPLQRSDAFDYIQSQTSTVTFYFYLAISNAKKLYS